MAASAILRSLFYPSEVSALLRYQFSSDSPRKARNASAKYLNIPYPIPDPLPSREKCIHYLFRTSRSFAVVVSQLDEPLRTPTLLFYLILRGLDTIEDDMTLDPEKKNDLLLGFHDTICESGWNFDGINENEKDRVLLLDFQCVIEEFLKLDKDYREVIKDITKKMGEGMAKYAKKGITESGDAAETPARVESISDFDEYCYYVAGLVGEGLTRLFEASRMEPRLKDPGFRISYDMGLFLQKTNILRDFVDDYEGGRSFWPKEIWSNYVDQVGMLVRGPKYQCLACIDHLVMNSLTLVPSVLDYLSMLRNQSVFRFCAIPQVMAIATLDLLFNNYDVFRKNGLKIRRGLAVKLIYDCTTFGAVLEIFEESLKSILTKNVPGVPGFRGLKLDVDISCGRAISAVHRHRKNLRWQKDDAYGTQDSPERTRDAERHLDVATTTLFTVLFFALVTLVASYFIRQRYGL